jgi:putative superfamily III holin-X
MNEPTNQQGIPAAEDRSIVAILLEIKDELKAFLDTRIMMFRSELKENLSTVRQVIPFAAFAGGLLLLAGLFFALALVGLVAVAFLGNPYAWFYSFLIVGVAFVLAGSILAFLARQAYREGALVPRKTFEVIKGDKVWIDQERRRRA